MARIEAQRLQAEIEKLDSPLWQKAIGYLDEFYNERSVSPDARLVLSLSTLTPSRLESMGDHLQQFRDPDTKQQKLNEYQAEMKAFGVFLRGRYFSS